MVKDKKIIAVCIAKIGDGGSYEYIKFLHSLFQKRGYRMMIYHTNSDFYWNAPNEAGERTVFDLIDYDITDAVIIVSSSFQSRKLVEGLAQMVKQHGKPVISIDGLVESAISVMPDYATCFEKIVRHVIEHHGIQDVGFIAGTRTNTFSEERLAIYRKVLAEKGIPCDEEKIDYGDFWSEPAKEAVRKMIQKNKLPKGLICANDVMAIAACDELKRHGYRVPEDVCVTGFDGILSGRYYTPNITSCNDNYEEVVAQVVSVLDNLFEGRQFEVVYKVAFQMHLAQSCGCAVERNTQIGSEMIALNDRLEYYKTKDRSFYEVSAKMLTCDSAREIAPLLRQCAPEDMICLVNKSFLEPNCIQNDTQRTVFDERMCVLYDTRKNDEGAEPIENCIAREMLVPDLEELLEVGKPLVFTAVCFKNHAIGYICTYFDLAQHCYLNISQCAIGIGNALCGFRNIMDQKYLNEQIERVYAHDALTGLLNRRGFEKYSKPLLEEMRAKGNGKLLILSADLDGLKQINDSFGHLEGDNAIYVAARAVKEAYPKKKLCLRFGGDEVLCLIPVFDEPDMKQKVRESIEQYLENYNQNSGKPYEVSMSMGFFLEEVEDFVLEQLMKKADANMYTEKRTKKLKK